MIIDLLRFILTILYSELSLIQIHTVLSIPNTWVLLSPGLMTIPLNRNMNHCHRIYICIYTYIYIYTWFLMKYNGNIMGIYIYIYILWHFSTVVAHIPIKSPHHMTGFLPPLNPHGPDSTLPQRPWSHCPPNMRIKIQQWLGDIGDIMGWNQCIFMGNMIYIYIYVYIYIYNYIYI